MRRSEHLLRTVHWGEEACSCSLHPRQERSPAVWPAQRGTCHSPPRSGADSGAASVRAAQPRETPAQLPTCCSPCAAPAPARRSGSRMGSEKLPAGQMCPRFSVLMGKWTGFCCGSPAFTKRENYLGFRLHEHISSIRFSCPLGSSAQQCHNNIHSFSFIIF